MRNILLTGLILAGCARPDAILYADFEGAQNRIGALPADPPPGEPEDDIFFSPTAASLIGSEVVAAPPFALNPSNPAEAQLDELNEKAYRIGEAGDTWFISELIPFASQSERHSVSMNGILLAEGARFSVLNNNLFRFIDIAVLPNQVTIAPRSGPTRTFNVSTIGRPFRMRIVVDPADQVVSATLTFGDRELTHSGAYPDDYPLNRVIFIGSGSQEEGAIVVDNIQATPPLNIRIGPASPDS